MLKTEKIDTIYIIGGRMIYRLFFSISKFLHITIIDDLDIKGDTFIPFTFSDINHHFKEKNRKKLSKKAEYILFKRI